MKKTLLTVVLPTYNESENVQKVIRRIFKSLEEFGDSFEILFVDDSTDGTTDIIATEAARDPRIRMIHRPAAQRNGLAGAFVEGFKHANGTYICCMDSDLQHSPDTIPALLKEITSQKADVAIASRYIKGGSAEGLGSPYRKLISVAAKYTAKFLLAPAPLGSDPGSGFFMFEKTLLNDVDLSPRGFKILIEILAKTKPAKIVEVPLCFLPRENNKSKATVTQGIEFLKHLFVLSGQKNFTQPSLHRPWKIWTVVYNRIFFSVLFCTIAFGIIIVFIFAKYENLSLLNYFIPIFSITVSIQGMFALFLMLYAWEDPDRVGEDASPKLYLPPAFSFTAIVPARHEENVIEDTIKALVAIDYPSEKKEILIVCREDDKRTIEKVNGMIDNFSDKQIRLIIFGGYPINKPHGLNIGLQSASNDVVVVFDAEDEPHPDIFKIVNTVMVRDGADVVQSGVQLMNYRSRWFSLYNVIEYYFWFKSSLHFFAKSNLIPLGGNTVFFKKIWLKKIGSWDEKCLTEDADIGIRLSLAGAKTRVIYDELHVTKEETPDTVSDFIKQRSRWNHGFLQILFKRDWLKLPKFSQRLLAFYVLTSPLIQAMIFLYAPVAIWMIFTVKLPVIVTLIATLPLYVLFLHFVAYLIGLYEFTRDYKLKFPIWMPLKAAIFYLPFQFLMGFSVFRAMIRNIIGATAWEKTEHLNLHREKDESRALVPTSVRST